jgi:hypothetical protein
MSVGSLEQIACCLASELALEAPRQSQTSTCQVIPLWLVGFGSTASCVSLKLVCLITARRLVWVTQLAACFSSALHV